MPTFSDHFPIKLKLKINSSNIILNPPQSFTSYKSTNWDQFRGDLMSSSRSIIPSTNTNLENQEIDALIKEFNTSFTHNS
ncbi:hypothetical protein CVS40_6570 [Lucilia cuprina]|nr:hypothetical protein CVS40_6570 [Lucilia cuprina]